jgi:hypothetical protein
MFVLFYLFVIITLLLLLLSSQKGYEAGVAFIQEQFTKRHNVQRQHLGVYPSSRSFHQCNYISGVDSGARKLYLHVTCATDAGNVSYVFNDVCDIIIRSCVNTSLPPVLE